jgi:hypothetical protein
MKDHARELVEREDWEGLARLLGRNNHSGCKTFVGFTYHVLLTSTDAWALGYTWTDITSTLTLSLYTPLRTEPFMLITVDFYSPLDLDAVRLRKLYGTRLFWWARPYVDTCSRVDFRERLDEIKRVVLADQYEDLSGRVEVYA